MIPARPPHAAGSAVPAWRRHADLAVLGGMGAFALLLLVLSVFGDQGIFRIRRLTRDQALGGHYARPPGKAPGAHRCPHDRRDRLLPGCNNRQPLLSASLSLCLHDRYRLCGPAVTGAYTLAPDAAPKPILGSIMGGLTTMQPIGVLIFLQAGGFLFDRVGYWAPFALKGAADLACALWILAVRKRIGREEGK